MKVLVGIKKGMTRLFSGDEVIPVTILDTSDAVVSYADEHGMELGIGRSLNSPNPALKGKYEKIGKVPLHRVWIDGDYDVKVGDLVELAEEMKGSRVDVTSISKGKGFAGVVKRWGFKGGPRTHGQSDGLRAPGSIGAGTTPGRVLKGKKMGGRMGGERVTVKNKKIIDIKDNYLLISGAVPGAKGSVVTIKIKE